MKIESMNGSEKELNIFIKDLLIFVGRCSLVTSFSAGNVIKCKTKEHQPSYHKIICSQKKLKFYMVLPHILK